MAALRRDESGLTRQIRADNLARAFLKGLITQYGENAALELVDGPEDPHWRLAGEPLDTKFIDVSVERQGDRFVMDLVSRATGVAIHNVQSWDDAEGFRHAVVPLRELWVYSSVAIGSEPSTRQLFDGRTLVQIEEDDGSLRHLTIDNEGNSAPVSRSELPAAAFPELTPSIGVGVRRESEHGPHVGRGMGGKWDLTGDLETDREVVVSALQQLIERAERGELDEILAFRAKASEGSPEG
jgi:hypothetical protein